MATLTRPRLFRPQILDVPRASKAAPGMKLLDLSSLGYFPSLYGSRSGYHTEGDVVTQTADGVDLNSLWADYQQTLALYNARRQALVSILTYPVNQLIENVPQVGEASFERASEFGIPQAVRVQLDYFQMAYDFDDYDVATRYTWKFLRDADQRQIDAVHSAILDADARLQFRKVMEAIFDNRSRVADIRGQNYNVYPLYNGDSTVPPKYKNTTHTAPHDHYIVSTKTQIDPDDLEVSYEHLRHHGFGIEEGTRIVHLLNRAQMTAVRAYKAGQTFNGVVANYDFIPAATQPTMIVPNEAGLLGSPPPSTWNGLPVTGSYGDMLLIEEDYIPAGYMLTFGSGGAGQLSNLVGFREHANPQYRGLRLLPGNQQRYPLIDSYYARGFGTGVRQRGGAVVTQFKASGSYDIPAAYMKGGGLT